MKIDVTELSRVRLDPGDVLIVNSKRPLSSHTREVLGDLVRGVFPTHKVLVLEPDFQLSVVRGSKAA